MLPSCPICIFACCLPFVLLSFMLFLILVDTFPVFSSLSNILTAIVGLQSSLLMIHRQSSALDYALGVFPVTPDCLMIFLLYIHSIDNSSVFFFLLSCLGFPVTDKKNNLHIYFNYSHCFLLLSFTSPSVFSFPFCRFQMHAPASSSLSCSSSNHFAYIFYSFLCLLLFPYPDFWREISNSFSFFFTVWKFHITFS